jgi:prepilin peptidase CpaA
MDLITAAMLGPVLAVAVCTDVRSQRIPNALTLPAMAWGLAWHGLSQGPQGLLFAFAGLGLGLALMLAPFLLGFMGGGDVKLMAAVGAFLGPGDGLAAFLYACLAGGLYALIVLARRSDLLVRVLKSLGVSLWLLATTGRTTFAPVALNAGLPRLCYGLAIAAGTLAQILVSLHGQGLLAIN